MALQSSFYAPDGATKTYPSTKHIATKQHVAVYLKDAITESWSTSEVSSYELINNSVVFDNSPELTYYSMIEIRVADTTTELDDSPSDISLVAGSINDVIIVSDNISSVNTAAANIGAINNVSANTADIDSVLADLASIRAVADSLESGTANGAQLLGSTVIRGIQYMSQSTAEQLTIPANTNAFSIGDFAIESGGVVVVPNGSVYKVI